MVFCFSTLPAQQLIRTFFALKLETKNEGILAGSCLQAAARMEFIQAKIITPESGYEKQTDGPVAIRLFVTYRE